METTREENHLAVRLDPGENVLESLETLREEYQIDHGFLTGIGAVDRVVLGHYDWMSRHTTNGSLRASSR